MINMLMAITAVEKAYIFCLQKSIYAFSILGDKVSLLFGTYVILYSLFRQWVGDD